MIHLPYLADYEKQSFLGFRLQISKEFLQVRVEFIVQLLSGHLQDEEANIYGDT